MGEYFTKFFSTSDFPARWQCGNWSDFLGWLHITSDLATFAAYFAIPAVLLYFARQRQDIPFSRLFILFAAFIVACGTVHLIEAIIFWHPIYRISGLVKFLTAVISWTTVVTLVYTIPQIVHFPSLAAVNQQLAEREQRLATVLAATAEGVYGVNREGYCTFANQACAELLGFASPADLHGKQMHELIHHSHADGSAYPCTDCRIATAYQAGEPVHSEEEVFWRADGTPFSVEYWAYPKLRGSEVVGCVVTFLDISERMQAQRELEARERQLKTITDAIPPMIAFVDRDYRYNFVNQAYAEQWNRPVEEIIGQKVWDIVGKANFADIEPHLQKAMRGEPESYELKLNIPRDGSLQYKEVTYVPEVRDDGSVAGTHVVITDVTERKQSEQALRTAVEELEASNAKLRGLFDVTVSFMGVLDLEGRVQEANSASTIGCGYQKAEVIDQYFWECPWWSGSDEIQQEIRAAVGTALTGAIVRREFEYWIGDGSQRIVDFAISPALNEQGEVLFLVPSGVDVTDRKRSERAIRLSEERLRSAAETAGFGMLHADLGTGTVTFSAETQRLLGAHTDQEGTFQLNELPAWFHPDDVAACRRFFAEISSFPEGSSSSIDHRVLRSDGEVRWMRLQAKPLYSGKPGERRATELIATMLDITQQHNFEQSLREAREQADAANESKSLFLANMSHEIRTPMTAILGYTDLVAEKINDAEALKYLQTIHRNGDFLLEIINDILDLSKIEAGKFEIRTRRFAPHELVEDVRSIMDVRAAENQLALDVEYQGPLPTEIESDPKRLKQILINLVGNAIKFTPSGSVRIKVRYVPEDATGDSSHPRPALQFDVVDSGIGMSPQLRSRLFQPFSQGDGNVNREFGGTGLGLAISKRLTEMLGGQISVQSQLGQGSSFTLTIATGDLSGVELVYPKLLREPTHKASGRADIRIDGHILVVDDRRDIRFLTRNLLSKAGAKVSEAEDGERAVCLVQESLLQSQPYALILLDMQMPKLDGYQTAVQLRQLGYRGPIVALTADAMQGDMKRCIACGCNDYLSKPIDATKLLSLVKQLAVAP